MVDIVATKNIPVTDLMANISLYKYNPSAIQQSILDYLEAVTNGQVDIVDPTNPFIFLLEASSVNTAVSMLENRLATRKQYAVLAQTEEELYIHMSDKDFIGRFATPSETTFTLLIQVSSLLGKMVHDSAEQCYKAIIPRNTEFKIEDWTFSLEYPVVIRKFDSGVVQVSYDVTETSPLRKLSTNIIDYVVTKDADSVNWLKFNVPVSQFKITSTEFPVQASTAFNQVIPFSDSYYYCRVFYKKASTNGKWLEMATTHTDQVYDPYKPTAVLKVLTTEGTVTVSIPTVYVNNQVVDGVVRVDVYSSKGALTANLNNYLVQSFTTVLKAIDEINDLNVYTTAMTDVAFMAYSDAMVTGGSDQLAYLELRDRVINNSVGARQIPITSVQLQAGESVSGFSIVKNIDLVTNRIFIATQNLPYPTNTRLITPANITVDTFVCNMDTLKDVAGVFDNGYRLTLSSSLLYLYNNGKITIVPKSQVDAFKRMSPMMLAELSNNTNFLYSPFYYVLDDTMDEFELRAYHLDQPSLTNLNFVSQNPTVQLPVNTSSYQVNKTETGYRITVITKSGNFYKSLADNYVNMQLSFVPVNENEQAYLNGTLRGRTADNERIFDFDLVTNHDVDSDHLLYFNNFKMFSSSGIKVPTTLSGTFNLYHTTSSVPTNFVESNADYLIGKAMLPANSVAVTHETIDVTFGHNLKNLWTQSRSVASGLEYARYSEDVPMYYQDDVYVTDPVTGAIFAIDPMTHAPVFNLLHKKGDVVLNDNGEVIYAHRMGDVILNAEYKAKVIGELNTARHCDMFFVDGNYYFSSDQSYIDYRGELSNVVSKWVINDLDALNETLLEQTRIYYYPKKSIGLVTGTLSNNSTTALESQQSFTVTLYVRDNLFKDLALREEVRRITVAFINASVQSNTVSISTMTAQLRNIYDSGVVSFKINGLGGIDDYEVVSVNHGHEQLCLKKHLVAQEDGTLIVAEAVTVNFISFNEV